MAMQEGSGTLVDATARLGTGPTPMGFEQSEAFDCELPMSPYGIYLMDQVVAGRECPEVRGRAGRARVAPGSAALPPAAPSNKCHLATWAANSQAAPDCSTPWGMGAALRRAVAPTKAQKQGPCLAATALCVPPRDPVHTTPAVLVRHAAHVLLQAHVGMGAPF